MSWDEAEGIRSDVPMPIEFKVTPKRGDRPRYGLKDIPVGGSKLVDSVYDDRRSDAVAAMKAHARRTGKTLEAKRDDVHPHKIRIWRTA